MKNVLDPCCKCPEALCLMAGAEEGRGERARPSPRPLDLEAEDAGHSVADDPWLHAKKKKKRLSRFVRATAPAASHRYRRRSSEPKDLYHKRRVIRRRREAKGTNTCRMVPLKPTFLQYQPSTCKTWEISPIFARRGKRS